MSDLEQRPEPMNYACRMTEHASNEDDDSQDAPVNPELFESDIDAQLFAVMEHMGEQSFSTADRDYVMRSFLPSHAQQAIANRDHYNHPNDWMLALRLGRSKDAAEEKSLVTNHGFPARPADVPPYNHIKEQVIHLCEKYPMADWNLLMDGLFDRLAARLVETAPDAEMLRRSALYQSFVRTMDQAGVWALPVTDKASEAEPEPEVVHQQDGETITPEEIARRLDCAYTSVLANLKNGSIPGGMKVGGKWVINRMTFNEWFRRTPPTPVQPVPAVRPKNLPSKPAWQTGGFTPSF